MCIRDSSTGILRVLPLSTRTLEQSLVCYTLSEVYRLPVRTYATICLLYTSDQDLFDRVQQRFEQNRIAHGRPAKEDVSYLLTTKLFCGKCGTLMGGCLLYTSRCVSETVLTPRHDALGGIHMADGGTCRRTGQRGTAGVAAVSYTHL